MILSKFRELLKLRNIGIYVLPRTDEHQSEYLCECDQRLAFLTGFTGSNGLAVVSQKEALVWTDSRYYVQIKKELTEGWEMRKMGPGETTWFQHIKNNYDKDQTIGFDARLLSAEVGTLRKKFLETNGFKLDFMNQNLVDLLWQQRPPPSCTDIFVHQSWAGTPALEKFAWIRNKIVQSKGIGCLFTDLSQICWVLNVRSSEIPYNPFMKSVFILRLQGQVSQLYLPESHPCLKISSEQLIQHFKNLNVIIKPYPFLPLPANLLCRKSSLNLSVYNSLENPIEWEGIGLYRARRNKKQQDGFRQCHIYDGVAMASFWGWRSTQEVIGEHEAAMEMDKRRYKLPLNKGLSFTTISAGGPNAALPHYHASNNPDFKITKDMIHLVDSGGQYLNGTTDVTRTFHFGNPSQQQKIAYTRVLLGNLDIQRMVWPKNHGLKGSDFDVLARRRLWQIKLDYGHGTGHGVGYFEGVHQGPVGISKYNTVVFEEGMIVSNQPGYYKQGHFGIRIQNLIFVIQKDGHYTFENFTLCPYDLNLIQLSLLTRQDRIFINDYHEKCRTILSPHLQDDELGLKWLNHATRPIPL